MTKTYAIIENEQERKKLEYLYENNKKNIYNFAMRYAKNKDIAEEAIQNALVYIIKNKEKYINLSCREFGYKIIIVIRDRCKNIFKYRKKYLEKFIDKDIREVENFIYKYEPSIDEKLDIIYDYELIRKHFKSLDEISNRVLEMKYIYGKSYKEIGKELNMTEKHVDTKIMRAKEKIRKFITKEHFNYYI